MPESAWRRMYLADYSLSSGFFPNIEDCIQGDLLEEPLPGKSYVAGLDLGVSRDFTVLIIMDADERKVVYHKLWDSQSWPQVQQHIAAISEEAPAGEHDDEVFALGLALSACNEPQGSHTRRRGFGKRYMPTQAEANSGYGMGGMSPGEKIMKERRLARVEERWDKSGVNL